MTYIIELTHEEGSELWSATCENVEGFIKKSNRLDMLIDWASLELLKHLNTDEIDIEYRMNIRTTYKRYFDNGWRIVDRLNPCE